MLNKESLQREFEGLGEEESLRLLAEKYQIHFNPYPHTNILWFAKVFTSHSAYDLEYQINLFLWFINNIVVPITRTCFNEEDTVSLADNCCGSQTTILYYTLTRNI